MVNWKLLTNGFERLIQKHRHDLQRLEQGNVRVSERTPDGWQDRTALEMHEKRNLIATLEATLSVLLSVRR